MKMNQYRILKNNRYDIEKYRIEAIRKEDIQKIRTWRNQQINVLRQKELITENEQNEYYNDIIKKSFNEDNPKLMLFSFILEDRCIGYGGITNIDWKNKNCELSFLLDTNRIHDNNTYERDFTVFLNIISKITFNELGFNKIVTETYDIRLYHVQVLEKNRFYLVKRIKNEKSINGLMIDVLIHSRERDFK